MMDRLLAYLDGRLSPEEQQRLRGDLEGDAELRRALAELVYQRRLLVELGTEEEHAADIAHFRRDASVSGRRIVMPARPPWTGRTVSRRVRFVWIAVAACLAAAIGIPVAYRRMSPPAPSSALERLASTAEDAKTVADLRALDDSCRKLYEEELARGDECDLLRLVHLGLATSMTGNPKQNRQVEDLRFILGQAIRAGAAADIAAAGFDLMPVAEAAVSTALTVEEARIIRRGYATAREEARRSCYGNWHELNGEIYRFCLRRGKDRLAGVLAFELAYITFYERGLAQDVKQRLPRLLSDTMSDNVFTRYLAENLLPLVEPIAAEERRLESNIDFASRTTFGPGEWEVGDIWEYAGGKPLEPWYKGISEKKVTKGDTGIYFRRPRFREAIVTGQAHVHTIDSGGSPDDRLWGAGLFFHKGNVVDWHLYASSRGRTRAWDLKTRWYWFRTHYTYEDNGVWSQKEWTWLEGHQPHDLRRIDESELPPTKVTGKTPSGVTFTAFHGTTDNRPDTAMLGFKTAHAGVEWRALGLEIIRSADGAPPVARVLFRDDLEKGLGNWRGHVSGKPGWKNDHLSAVELDTPRGRTKALRVDCAGAGRDTMLVAGLRTPIKSPAIALECDMLLEKTYGKSWYWEISCSMPKEGMTWKETYRSKDAIKMAEKVGTWWKYRREFRVVPKGSKYEVHLKSYINGKMNSQYKVETSYNPENRWMVWFGVKNARMALDNMVIRKLEPEKTKKKGEDSPG